MMKGTYQIIVIVEAKADYEIATSLAERVFKAYRPLWFTDNLTSIITWRGVEPETSFSCWKDYHPIEANARQQGYRPPRYLGHTQSKQPCQTDCVITRKFIRLIKFITTRNNPVRAVLLIRDLDNQPERQQGLRQAKVDEGSNDLQIIVGTANPNREAWVLNGFIPNDETETEILREIYEAIHIDPCLESHRLRRQVARGHNRAYRDIKKILAQLTQDNKDREALCWIETPLDTLLERGTETGLTDYLQDIQKDLLPIFV